MGAQGVSFFLAVKAANILKEFKFVKVRLAVKRLGWLQVFVMGRAFNFQFNSFLDA